MSMTVDQMILLSRLFLGAMIILTIVAVVLFFVFDVRRAWRILRGKKLPPVHKYANRRYYKVASKTGKYR